MTLEEKVESLRVRVHALESYNSQTCQLVCELKGRLELLEARHACNCICWDCESERSDSMREALRKSLGINQYSVEA